MLAGFITLTLIDGTKFDAEALRPNISILRPAIEDIHCAKKHATAIVIGGKPLCVLETREQLRQMICEANEDCHK